MPSLKLVIISCVLYSVIADDPILELPNGKIKGKVITTRAGVDFYSYTQIPFAKPPVGDLRFKAPEPAEKWDGTLDCTQSTKFCYNIGSSDESQTEDCLYLNVYVPVNGTGNMPVMYHIFGGGFVQGNALFESNGPHYFMEYGVIVVTVNYRVGSFGFLSTGDTVIPGNFGLKDQNLGLKWVRDNIHYFGGDPSKVTVFGLSAGGASTTFHIISKQSQGLFRAAFAESGSALNPWAYQRYANKIAYQLATLIDPNFNESSTSEKLLCFLQTVPAKDLNAASNNINVGYIDEMAQGFHFAPVVEPEHDGAFITETAYESLESGNLNKVPLIIGMTSEEGLYRLNNGYYQYHEGLKTYDEHPTYVIPENMHVTDETTKETLAQTIKKFYVDGNWYDHLCGSMKQFSDTCFNRPLIKYAQLQSKYTDVYFYEFAYHGVLPGYNLFLEGCGKCRHAEDADYLWAYGGNDHISDYREEDILTSKRYLTMLTNFAKHLNPTPEPIELLQNLTWTKMTPDQLNYLEFDKTLQMKVNPKQERYNFWVDLYDKYAVRPLDTY